VARQVQNPPTRGRQHRGVPNEWFNGEWWEIEPGKDVPAEDPEQARRLLYQIGRYRGKTPRTRVLDGKVYIQRR